MAEWSYPLFGCFYDRTQCLTAFFCPCVSVGKNAQSIGEDENHTCLAALAAIWCCPPAYTVLRMFIRHKIRERKNIKGNIVKDCLYVTFCDTCTLIQEKRELDEEERDHCQLIVPIEQELLQE